MVKAIFLMLLCVMISGTPTPQQNGISTTLQDLYAKYETLERRLDNIESQLVKKNNETSWNINQTRNDLKNCMATSARLTTELHMCTSIPAKFPASCHAWKAAGYTDNGLYVIDPDGPGGVQQFQVECDMSNHLDEAVTIIHHANEARAKASDCETSVCSVHVIQYQANMQQIVSVIDTSNRCDQFVKYECLNSMFYFGYRKYAAWYSRNGTEIHSWGGAPTGSGLCACGTTNSCDSPGERCNCDSNDNVWRLDEGLLSDMDALPVTKLAFGDLGSDHEKGYYRLGPLRCYG